MKTHLIHILLLLFIELFPFEYSAAQAPENNVLEQTIRLDKSKNTVYRLLGEISDRCGYLFIYDSKVIDNEKTVKIKSGTYKVKEAIYRVTGNNKLELRVIGNHILISRPDTPVASPVGPATQPVDTCRVITLTGRLTDRETNEPVPLGTVSLVNSSVGNITNQNGEFRLTLPDTLSSSSIQFSHMGYQTQVIETQLLAGRFSVISLVPKVIPIQEVVVRVLNPLRLLRELEEKKARNYAQHPFYLTTFYREGIERKNKFVSLTEAVFKIYKTPYAKYTSSDQVKLLKMRRISDPAEKDTLVTKMKSGIEACLLLDIMKDIPEFLTIHESSPYNYAPTDITVLDDKLVNVVYFEQKKSVDYPLYKGELYIDPDSSILLRARFELNPRYIGRATGMLVEKKSRHLQIIPQQAVYTVSYKKWKGTHYINHVRGDLHFKVKRKKQLFGGYPVHAWFEMATCKIETVDVSRFARQETLPLRTIFSDTPFSYDAGFWEDFNFIPTEEELNEAIRKISLKIEETGY